MAKITPNLSLVNPEKGLGEKYSLALWTANNDKIDARAAQVEEDLGNAEGRLDLAETDLDALELSKVDKVTGKGLSTNDYTDLEKQKLNTDIPAQLAEKVQNDINLQNKIVNGDFSQGTAGWIRDSSNTTISAANNVLSISSSQITQVFVQRPLSVPNQAKMYIRQEFEIDKPVTKVYSRAFNGGYEIASNAPVVNTPQILSGVVINDGSDFTIRFIQSVAQLTTLKVKKVLAVDLTAIFGSGNEPTKEEMDRLISMVPNQWWDGELDLTQKQYVNWLLSVIREKANKAQEAWITPTLLNGWLGFGDTPVKYMKDTLGFVHIRGAVSNGINAVFILPVGYRPDTLTLRYPITTAAGYGRVTVYGNGNVEIIVGSSTWSSLDGISFKAV